MWFWVFEAVCSSVFILFVYQIKLRHRYVLLKNFVYLHTCVHNSTIHSSQEMEATQISTKGWVDEQNVIYTYSGILFSLKKEGKSDASYNMDEPWGHYAEWNKPITKRRILVMPLTWGLYSSQIHRSSVVRWLPGAGERGR